VKTVGEVIYRKEVKKGFKDIEVYIPTKNMLRVKIFCKADGKLILVRARDYVPLEKRLLRKDGSIYTYKYIRVKIPWQSVLKKLCGIKDEYELIIEAEKID
jgi:hypothetical protein